MNWECLLEEGDLGWGFELLKISGVGSYFHRDSRNKMEGINASKIGKEESGRLRDLGRARNSQHPGE